MIARLFVMVAAAGMASTAFAQNAGQLENALSGTTYRCEYSNQTDPDDVTGGHTMMRLREGGQAQVVAPNSGNAQNRSGVDGRWWADGGMTVCLDLGSGAQCGMVNPDSPNRMTMMTQHGQVPCTAQ